MVSYLNMMTQTRFDLPRFVESAMATEVAEDWSRVRSPGRARRRLRRGFPQNIRHYRKPSCFFIKAENTYYIHPEMMKALKEQTKNASELIDRRIQNSLYMGILGRF